MLVEGLAVPWHLFPWCTAMGEPPAAGGRPNPMVLGVIVGVNTALTSQQVLWLL